MTTATITSIHRRLTESLPTRRKRLDRPLQVARTKPLAAALGRQIIGQDAALEPLVSAFSRSVAGLNDPERPLLTVLLLGPTGVGKTETARTIAESLFGSPAALTRINCEEYSNGHELGKLFGSPPGYVGHDIEPLLSQEHIDTPHARLRRSEESERRGGIADELFGADRPPVSVILFDEIEKAHPRIWNSLLGALDDGRISLGDNRTTSLRRSILILTSNVGSEALSGMLHGDGIGFQSGSGAEVARVSSESVRHAALEAARRSFPPEFLNRMDLQLVYEPLRREHLRQILDRLVHDVHRRVLEFADVPMLIRLSRQAKEWLIDRGTEPGLGARPLRRAVESGLVDPLAEMLIDGHVSAGDVLEVDVEQGELAFFRVEHDSEIVVA